MKILFHAGLRAFAVKVTAEIAVSEPARKTLERQGDLYGDSNKCRTA